MTNNLDDPEMERAEWLGFHEEEVVKEFVVAVRDIYDFYSTRSRDSTLFRGIIRQKPWYGRKRLDAVVREFDERARTVVDTDDYLQGRATMLAGDVIIGTTTLMIETAAFLGLPTVSYLPNVVKTDDPKVSNHEGITMPLYERGALHSLILSIARNGGLAEGVIRNRAVTLPENATGNVADFLKRFA